jgi:hypothetical protein
MRPSDQAATAMPSDIHGRAHGGPGMHLRSAFQYSMDMHSSGYTRVPGREGGGVKGVEMGGEYKGGEVQERGLDADRRLAVLFENNQYLRQVNKSLIAERENLNAEIEQCDLESDELLVRALSLTLLSSASLFPSLPPSLSPSLPLPPYIHSVCACTYKHRRFSVYVYVHMYNFCRYLHTYVRACERIVRTCTRTYAPTCM